MLSLSGMNTYLEHLSSLSEDGSRSRLRLPLSISCTHRQSAVTSLVQIMYQGPMLHNRSLRKKLSFSKSPPGLDGRKEATRFGPNRNGLMARVLLTPQIRRTLNIEKQMSSACSRRNAARCVLAKVYAHKAHSNI